MAKSANRKPLGLDDPADAAPPPRGKQTARKAPAKPAVEAVPNEQVEDADEVEDDEPERRKAQSVWLPESIIARGHGIVGRAQYLGEPPGISSIADLYTQILDAGFRQIEDEYNDGQPFPLPANGLRTGPGRAGAARISAARRRSKKTK